MCMTLAAVGSARTQQFDAFRKQWPGQWRTICEAGTAETCQGQRARRRADAFLLKDPADMPISTTTMARHDSRGSAKHHAQISGREARSFTHDRHHPESPTHTMISRRRGDNCVEPSLVIEETSSAAEPRRLFPKKCRATRSTRGERVFK